MLLFLLSPARAFTEELMRMTIQELAPRVEAAAERPFLYLPPVVSLSREEALAQLKAREEREQSARIKPASDPSRREEEQRMVEESFAFYSVSEQKIYLITGNLTGFMEDTGVTMGPLFGAVARCVVAHELAHALQHQYAERSPPGALELQHSRLALWEGQAHLIAQRSCNDPQAWQLLEASQGIDVLSSADPSDSRIYHYGYGFRFMSAVAEAGGMAATWNALLLPPPSPTAIEAVVRPSLIPGWRDPSYLVALLKSYHPENWKVKSGPVGSYDILPQGEGRQGELQVAPPAVAGLRADAAPDRSLLGASLASLVMKEASAAMDFVESRWAKAQYMKRNANYIFIYYDFGGLYGQRQYRLPKLGVDSSMCLEFHDHRHYQECWAADGRVLHRVVSNRAHRNEGVPIEILENMIARARAGLTSPTPVGPEGKKVLQTYVLAPSSAAAPSALWSLNRLESRLAVGEEPEPAVRLQEIFREANFRDDSEAIARGVELALSFGFLEQVPTILGTHRLPGPYRAALAGLAMDQEEASLAKTLLGPIEDPDPEWVATMAELSLDIAFALQDREQLLVLVAHPALSPSSRSAAVRQLIKWKEGKRLRAVLETTCPTLPDAIAAECARDLALLKT